MGENEGTARETVQINHKLPLAFARLWATVADLQCSGRADVLRDLLLVHCRRIIHGATGRGIITAEEVFDATAGTGGKGWDAIYDAHTQLLQLIQSRRPTYWHDCMAEMEAVEHAWLSAPKTEQDIDSLKAEMKNR